MLFRIILVIVTFCSWGIAIWMATHSSDNADVFSRYSHAYFVLLIFFFVISTIFTYLHFGSAYQWVLGKRHNITLLILSLVISLACVEVMVRVLDPIGISYYEHTKNYHLEKIPDDDLYYRHRSNLDRMYQGVSVKTNTLGMRDEPISDKENGELRIMFLGDSVTFGWGARQEDIFVRRVGEILEKDLNRPIRTINTGVGSYNTHNENAVLIRYGGKLEPDAVVLMYVINDIAPTTGEKFDPWSEFLFKDKSPPEIVNLILGKSWTFRLVSHLSRLGKRRIKARLSATSEGWLQSVAALQEIDDFCDFADIPLFVFMFRMVPSPLGDDLAKELNTLAESRKFYFGDVLPWFDDRDIRLLVNSRVDRHANAAGHAILANGIADVMIREMFSSRDRSN